MAEQNFIMFAGDTKLLQITVKDDAGVVVDITGSTARYQMSRSPNSLPPDVEKATGAGIVLTDPVNGRLDITLASADTEDLTGRYYQEIEIIDESDNVSTVLYGYVTIRPALIKPE